MTWTRVLRGLCQGFVQVVNQSKLPMFGFRRPNAISWKEFGAVYISRVAFDHGIGRVFLSNGESCTAADRELQLGMACGETEETSEGN